MDPRWRERGPSMSLPYVPGPGRASLKSLSSGSLRSADDPGGRGSVANTPTVAHQRPLPHLTLRPVPVKQRPLRSESVGRPGSAVSSAAASVHSVKVAQPKKIGQCKQELLACLQQDVVDLATVESLLIQAPSIVDATEDAFGWAPLLFAAHTGNLQLIATLLDNRASVRVTCNNSNTALQFAARGGFLPAVEYLIARGSQKNSKNKNGWTPLIWAAINGHARVVETLINAKADPAVVDCEGRSATMWAAKHGHFGVLKLLLATGPDLSLYDEDGLTVMDHADTHMELRSTLLDTELATRGLQAAAKVSDIDGVARALEAGAIVNATDAGGATPLLLATANGSVDLVRLLMQHGAHTTFDGSAMSLLQEATEKLHDEEVTQALSNALRAGEQLLIAAKAGDAHAVEAALQDGAFVDVKEPSSGRTPLSLAVMCSSAETLILLINAKASTSIQDAYGWRPVHYAVLQGDPVIISTLCFVQVDLKASTYEGDLVQHIAARANMGHVVQLLHAVKCSLNAKNAQSQTPLQLSAVKGTASAARALLMLRAKPDVLDLNGRSVFSLAACHGHSDICRLLCEPLRATSKADQLTLSEHFSPASLPTLNLSVLPVPSTDQTPCDSARTDKSSATTASTASIVSSKSANSVSSTRTNRTDCSSGQNRGRPINNTMITPLGSVSEGSKTSGSKSGSGKRTRSVPRKRGRDATVGALDVIEEEEEVVSPIEPLADPFDLMKRAANRHLTIPIDQEPAVAWGPALNGNDRKGRPPLLLATEARMLSTVSWLLDKKAAVNASDPDGNTALMIAARNGDLTSVETLLLAGAEMDLRNGEGKKAIDCAEDARVRSALRSVSDRCATDKILRRTSRSQPPGRGDKAGSGKSAKPASSCSPSPSHRVRVERLPVELSVEALESHIKKMLKKAGSEALRVEVATDPITERPRGFAYVEYADAATAESVALSGQKYGPLGDVRLVREAFSGTFDSHCLR
eukprot:TRINITY_DN49117_c0_g1_i1.p1 TRINITY_DN49117_c0_g1~~TRINITY_DN49117_c0_g1_i1.p1  ORF type:complete len:981 (-),score=136.01 TRINITY_DN49117_c0_g1_i1:33-2975(-)